MEISEKNLNEKQTIFTSVFEENFLKKSKVVEKNKSLKIHVESQTRSIIIGLGFFFLKIALKIFSKRPNSFVLRQGYYDYFSRTLRILNICVFFLSIIYFSFCVSKIFENSKNLNYHLLLDISVKLKKKYKKYRNLKFTSFKNRFLKTFINCKKI